MTPPVDPDRDRKAELRLHMRAARASMSRDAQATLSERVTAHLLALRELEDAAVVGLYAPIPDAGEFDTGPLHDALRARGKTLVYPRVRARGLPLSMHPVGDRAELIPGPLDIPQPARETPAVELATIHLFVVPGLAFDLHGERVGWGAGHYDRTLEAAPRAIRAGVGFDFQVVASVPHGAGDQHMDLVVTDAGTRVRRPR